MEDDGSSRQPFIKSMKHVLVFPDPHPSTDTPEEEKRIDAVVGKHVWAIVGRSVPGYS